MPVGWVPVVHDRPQARRGPMARARRKNEGRNRRSPRAGAADFNIPLLTNARLAKIFMEAVVKNGKNTLEIKSWEEY